MKGDSVVSIPSKMAGSDKCLIGGNKGRRARVGNGVVGGWKRIALIVEAGDLEVAGGRFSCPFHLILEFKDEANDGIGTGSIHGSAGKELSTHMVVCEFCDRTIGSNDVLSDFWHTRVDSAQVGSGIANINAAAITSICL